MGMMKFLIPLLSFMILNCPIGKEPPAETPMVEIKTGLEFVFGSTKMCFNANENPKTCSDANIPKVYPTMKVKIPSFFIDIHEVTNFQYEYCVEMGWCDSLEFTNTHKIEDYYGNPIYYNYPVVNVTWEMANKYCKAFNKRLPTQFEWERVAGGGVLDEEKKRLYPFENITDNIEKCIGKNINVPYCKSTDRPAEVMTSTDDYVMEGGRKIYDLGGNVSEWVEDFYFEKITCKEELEGCTDCWSCSPYDTECKEICYNCPKCENNPHCFKECDPTDSIKRPKEEGLPGYPVCISYGDEVVNPIEKFKDLKGNQRTVKGGDYLTFGNKTCYIRSSARYSLVPTQSSPVIGFRCAK